MEGKDIYILLVYALLQWRRPARPVDDALLAPWTTPCSPRGRRPARPARLTPEHGQFSNRIQQDALGEYVR
jgi:hypothetical protein